MDWPMTDSSGTTYILKKCCKTSGKFITNSWLLSVNDYISGLMENIKSGVQFIETKNILFGYYIFYFILFVHLFSSAESIVL